MAQVIGNFGDPSGQPMPNAFAVLGDSELGCGVVGSSRENVGVYAISLDNDGILGIGSGAVGVHGQGQVGVQGDGKTGVHGQGQVGVQGDGKTIGVQGLSSGGPGLTDGVGVQGGSDANPENGIGVKGWGFYGVLGITSNNEYPGAGVRGESRPDGGAAFSSSGVTGYSKAIHCNGVVGSASGSYGVGIVGRASGDANLAGWFVGDVDVSGTINKSACTFKIDHPLDPSNKYLYHSVVESPDMKNIYDGVVVLNSRGEAQVRLPRWFDALNKDFRYQLTAIGASSPNLHIKQEILKNTFKIGGGIKGAKVSWQVTGIRKDVWANAHRIPVEERKTRKERGFYLHPELHGKSMEKKFHYNNYIEHLENDSFANAAAKGQDKSKARPGQRRRSGRK